MTDQAGARSFAPPPLPTFEAMIDTIAKPIPTFVALVAGAAATVALAVALHGSASSQPEPTQAERAAAAPLVAPLPSPGESTRSQIDRFTAALAAAPRDPSAYDNLAFAELQMAREDGDPTWYTKANRLLERAVELAPRDPAAPAGLGSLAMSRHDFADADRLGRNALALAPDNAFALGVIVDANVELGRYAVARRMLERMLATKPNLSSYARASYLLELHGRVATARRAMVEAVRSGSPARENTAWAQVQLGNLDFNHGHYRRAAAGYAAALRTSPGNVAALAARARLDAALGRYDAAADGYRSVVARYPLPAYVIAYGDVLQAAGRHAAAQREYALVRAEEQLYAANGVDVDVELALFEADHGGDPAEAVRRVRSVAATAHSVTVWDALGWTLYRAGRLDAALSAANRALALGTEDAGFLFHRGAIEAELGDRSAARRDLAHALAVNPRFSILQAPIARRLLAEVS
jgi:tetratricopeptide (TPR) repeat protein